MPVVIKKTEFKSMKWKNGQGVTTQIAIFPETASIEKNDFTYRLSSAPIEKDGMFSEFPKKRRLLVPIKGAGFELNENVYEKFEIADFSGEQKTMCSLLKGPVVDFGVIFDESKVKTQARVLNLKAEMQFTLDTNAEYFLTVLSGELKNEGQLLSELETLHYQNENICHLMPVKNCILFYLRLEHITVA